MNPAVVLDTYRRMIAADGEWIKIRRYTGLGNNRPHFDVAVRAKVTKWEPEELVGSIQQGDRKLIVLVEDLIAAQFALPITAADKTVVRGRELAIVAPDDSTRRLGTTLIAYELAARG